MIDTGSPARPAPRSVTPSGQFDHPARPPESDVSDSTVLTLAYRARKLGPRIDYDPGSCRYRLGQRVSIDALDVIELARAGRPSDALPLYGGRCPPSSVSPFAAVLRASVEREVVAAVLASRDATVISPIGTLMIRCPLRPLGHHDDSAGRVLVPGSEWWYLRVRGELDQQNRLLARLAASPQLRRGEWFHVRYRDPSDELRLRVRAEGADVDGLCRLLGDCVVGNLAGSFILDTYVREVERYGGLEATRIAETLFCAESAFVVDHLGLCPPSGPMVLVPGSDTAADALLGPYLRDAAAFLDAYLGAGLGLAAAEVLELLEVVVAGYRREFPGDGAALRRAVTPLARQPASAAALAAADTLAAAVRGPGRTLDAILRATPDGGQQVITVPSLLHMFCNRLGMGRMREYQVAFLLLTVYRAAAHPAGRGDGHG